MDALTWLEGTMIAQAIRETPWMYPAFETTHYIGLAMLVGGIMLIDLRLLGFARDLPLPPILGLLPWVWAGFAINVVTGTLMFVYGATSFGTNRMFWLKMTLMALAGVNALVFTLSTRSADWIASGHAPGRIKAIATLSLALWLGVMAAGRWMAYV
ncbi:MAG: hypothetical protein LOD94_10935 [Gammaproteobacteria bacterium]|nr:hypothetical protein [Gammaproteobacteria bacterium]